MRGIPLTVVCFVLGCTNSGDMPQVLRSGLMGDETALQELSSGRDLPRQIADGDIDYGVKVHDLWRFLGARKGLAPAAVAIEQRTWHLLKSGVSPKEDFRASLAEISAKERNRNHVLADLADAIKAAIDGDITLANKMQEKLSASGFDTLSGEEIEYLADHSIPLLRPIAQGASHAVLAKGGHVYSVPVLFEIPWEIYIPWATHQENRPTAVDVDVRIRKVSKPLRFDSGNPAEGESSGKVFVFVCQPPNMDKTMFAEMELPFRDAIERVFSRYGLHLGRDVSVEGVPMRGSGFDAIANEIVRLMRRKSH